ncbi:MAG: PAS domain-containing protein, partial [Methanoregula sp.]|nr:PAS domain-containing protein [Methanoregula sp.]
RVMLLNARRIVSEGSDSELILLAIEDITGRKRVEEELLRKSEEVRLARDYAQSIVNTVREPLVVLNGNFEVVSASRAFYATFEVTPEATQGKVLYELGNNQWDIPRLHELLETVLPEKTSFENFDIEHDFPGIGRRVMLLNARRIVSEGSDSELILLAFEDVTGTGRASKR